MKSLIVEDEFTIRKLMQLYLMEFGPCHIAKNGKEAVDAFLLALDERQPYDLICMDIMMPEMDGMEAMERIRQIEAKRNILGLAAVKIIMTTAKGQSKDIFGAFNSGCEAYIIKPFHREDLLEEVGKLGLLPKIPSH